MSDTQWNIDPARIDQNWRAITIELDAPRPGPIEAGLRRVGFPAHLTRLMVATPGLRRAWYLAVAIVVVLALAPFDDTATRDDLFNLLLLAPLVPVLGVAFSYGVESDPAHEASLATPMRGIRLLITRAAVIMAVSMGVLGLVSLMAPGRSPWAFAWVLPAFAVTTLALALMTVLTPRRAAGVAAAVWIVGVFLARAVSSDLLAAFGAQGQALMLVSTIAALAVVWLRREQFDRLESHV